MCIRDRIFSWEDVFRDPALVERYGDAARVGAILVTTRDAAKQAEKEARKSGAGESVVASVPEGPSFGTVQTGNTPVEDVYKRQLQRELLDRPDRPAPSLRGQYRAGFVQRRTDAARTGSDRRVVRLGRRCV